MAFVLPEIVIESVIRDGIANMKNNEKVIDDVFASLKEPYISSKYGQAEIDRIKSVILNKKEISVVHNLSDIGMNVPCYSIQLGVDLEDKAQAGLGDHEGMHETPITDPIELAALIKVDNIVVDSFDVTQFKVTTATDLTDGKQSHEFIDASGTAWDIKAIDKANGCIYLELGATPDISDFCRIESKLKTVVHEEKYVASDETIIIGVHAKDALMAKYLYILLKYFMVSRKHSMQKRCFDVSSYNGSDFTRNLQMQGDQVYNRFLTITGKIEDTWNAGDVDQIDEVQVTVLVPKDEAAPEDINQENLTVKASDNDFC